MSAADPDYRQLLGDALLTVQKLRRRLESIESERQVPIAIVGAACRLPGNVSSMEDYWQLLARGGDAITRVPADRWDADAHYDADPDAPGKLCTREGGFLKEKDTFDPTFFRISPREATYMDPQHRLLLEVAWDSLADACISPNRLYGSETGVFIGLTSTDYGSLMSIQVADEEIDSTAATGISHSPAAGRLSYFLGLHGPSMVVDTACSSSLVAVHLACESLRRRECNAALAGGVNMLLTPQTYVSLSRAHMLSPDGRCKTFSDRADGYVRGEGAGIIVLKRLPDALADNDRILAVIRGSAVNQDGPSGGLTVPSGPAQQQVIRRALASAGLDPAHIDYIEAHGTGTALGDPIEINALGEVFASSRSKEQPLWVGSCKTNIGHLESGSGIAGLLKVVLQLQHGAFAPHLHFEKPSRRIPWDELPIRVPVGITPWPAQPGRRRAAGVSSFGFSGTNSHLVLEEAPAPKASEKSAERPLSLIALSAKSERALHQLCGAYAARLAAEPALRVEDVAYSTNTGRAQFEHRVAVLASDTAELQKKLTAASRGEFPEGLFRGRASAQAPRIGFLFTGQGSPYLGMGRALYDTQPTFRKTFDQLDALLKSQVGWSAREILYAPGADAALISQTGYAQPLLYCLQVSLATLWQSFGVRPAYVLGHSVGEYAAACVAQIVTPEDGLRLIAARGRLMQSLPAGGGMLAVKAPFERVAPVVEPFASEVSVAAINGPDQTVISGVLTRLDQLTRRFLAEGIESKPLVVSHAFHSPLMQPIRAQFAEAAAAIKYTAPDAGFISCLSGKLESEALTQPDYWVEHLTAPVRFQQGMEAMHAASCNLLLEVGPRPTLISMGRRIVKDDACSWLASLNPPRGDWEQLLTALAGLYTQGQPIDFVGFDKDYGRQKLALPSYPFQRQRYWFTPSAQVERTGRTAAEKLHPLLGRPLLEHSAGEGVAAFESELDETTPRYLIDHQVCDRVVFPAAGYIEMALAAARQVLSEPCSLVNFAVRAPLRLHAGERVRMRTILTPAQNGGTSFQIRSANAQEDPEFAAWTVLASGQLQPSSGPSDAAPELRSLPGEFPETREIASAYELMYRYGRLGYGPFFQVIKELRLRENEVLVRLALAEPLLEEAGRYVVHPVLMDGAFQSLTALLRELSTETLFLPTRVDALHLAKEPAGRPVWAHLVRRAEESPRSDAMTVDLTYFDAEGRVALTIDGLHLVRTSQARLLPLLDGDPSQIVYRVAWMRQGLPARAAASEAAETAAQSRRWLVIPDRAGYARELASALEKSGDRCEILDDPAHEVTQGALAAGATYAGILYFAGLDLLDAEAGMDGLLKSDPLLGCGTLLRHIQALHQRSDVGSARFCIFTRGAQPVAPRVADLRVEQSALTGFFRVMRIDLPSFRPVQIDLEPSLAWRQDPQVEVRQIVAELQSESPEQSIALRAGLRYVARLEHFHDPARLLPQMGPEEATELFISNYGAMDNLILSPTPRRAPGPGEIEIEVRAAGANFKDVLLILGMLKQHAKENGLPWSDQRRLGLEGAGVVVAVGEGVTHLKVGDGVITFGTACMRTHLTVAANTVVAKPKNLGFEEAAALPVAMITAYYGLHTLAQLRAGDKVLIHAAAGGVGQAAIQLCRRIGAEIFATASPGKWDFLRAQGVRHVMHSRNLDFRDQVLALTGGKGVDVVLNSLRGDFIPYSLQALAQGGRFVEIGKIGIWSAAEVAAQRPDVGYFPFELSELPAEVRDTYPELLGITTRWLEAGEIQPLPIESFPLSEAKTAYRRLGQGDTIGKVVVRIPTAAPASMPDQPHPPSKLRDDRTYLVTGGLGALGLEVVEWFVAKGARHLVLLGRHAPTAEAQRRIERLTATGVRIATEKCDVMQLGELRRVIEGIQSSATPLAGVIHLAGVLADVPTLNQTTELFAHAMNVKVLGAWNLHVLTRELPLELFLCFSSMSAILGWRGQPNYAAGNAVLDALMEHRRAHALPGISVGFGPWGQIGMVSRLRRAQRAQLHSEGLRLLLTRNALSALDFILRCNIPHTGVVDTDWKRYQKAQGPLPPRLIEELAGGAQSGDEESDSAGGGAALKQSLEQLQAAPPRERRTMLMSYVRGLAARLLGFSSAEQIEPQQRFFDLGIDSLGSVELRNRLEALLGCTLPATIVIDYPTADSLSTYLHDQVFGGATTLSAA